MISPARLGGRLGVLDKRGRLRGLGGLYVQGVAHGINCGDDTDN